MHLVSSLSVFLIARSESKEEPTMECFEPYGCLTTGRDINVSDSILTPNPLEEVTLSHGRMGPDIHIHEPI